MKMDILKNYDTKSYKESRPQVISHKEAFVGCREPLSIPKRWVVILLLLLSAVQLLQTVLHFEPVSGILSNEPLYPFDYSVGYYYVESAKQRFMSLGQFHGYDPYFMAGYPELYLENNHTFIMVLSTLIFPFVSSALVMKLFFIIALTLTPSLFFLSFRNFDIGEKGALAGTLLALTYIRVGLFVFSQTGGGLCSMLGFIFSLLYLSFYYRFLKHGSLSATVIFSIMTPLLPLLHKNYIVIVPIPMTLLFFVYRSRFSLYHGFLYLLLVAVSVVVNAFWLLPCLSGLQYVTKDPLSFWLCNNPLKILLDYFSLDVGFGGTVLSGMYGTLFTNQIILVLAVKGLFNLKKRPQLIPLFIAILYSSLFYLFLSYYGSFFGFLQQLEPYRYVIWMNFLLIVPASIALDEFLSIDRLGKPIRFQYILRVASILCVTIMLNILPSCQKLLEIHPHRTAAEGYLDDLSDLKNWINENTDTRSRILLENAGASFGVTREGPYMDSFPHGILALQTGREYLSTKYPFCRMSFSFPSFSNGIAFGKNIQAIDPDAFRSYLDLYNCGWVILWNQGVIDIVRDKFDFLGLKKKIGTFMIFQVEDPMENFFLKGSGTVHADYEGIFLTDLQPEDGEVILSYHYVRDLRSNPPLVMDEAKLCDDPHGFIRLYNPPVGVSLYYR